MAASSAEKIVCPKCGFEQYKRSAICKKCGLIFDKWREAQSKRQKAGKAERAAEKVAAGAAGAEAAAERTASRRLVLIVLLLIGAVAIVAIVRRSTSEPPVGTPPQPIPTVQGDPAVDGEEPDGPRFERKTPTPSAGTAPAATDGSTAAPAGAPSSLPRPAIDADYEAYLADLTGAVNAMESFERRLTAGVTFEEIQRAFLELRRTVSSLDAPDPGYVSYLSLQQALDAYSESLKFWDYRAYSERWQGELWCAGGGCPFDTEQGMREAVAGLITACWEEATRMRRLASQVATSGNPVVLEEDESLRQQVTASGAAVNGLWARLRPGAAGAAAEPAAAPGG